MRNNLVKRNLIMAAFIILTIGGLIIGQVRERANRHYTAMGGIVYEAEAENLNPAMYSNVYIDTECNLFGWRTKYDVVKEKNDGGKVICHVSRDGSVTYEAE